MKFEKEATTKNGRRTWKVTYELVRGPEPKEKRQKAPNSPSRPAPESKLSPRTTAKPAKANRKKPKPNPALPKTRTPEAKASQLGLF